MQVEQFGNEPVIGESEDYFDTMLACSGYDVVEALQALGAVVQNPLATVPHLWRMLI